jgi:uncharacterized membrane protein (UPF0127 family)
MNFRRNFSVFFFFAIFLFDCAGCGAENALSGLEKRPFRFVKTGSGEFETSQVTVMAEIARDEHERNTGLMYRRKLPEGEGMLFVFERDQILSFWMKNTFVPLSIAFIAFDGRIVDIRDMEPQSLTAVKSSRSVRYALEVPQGWFIRQEIREGDRIILESL